MHGLRSGVDEASVHPDILRPERRGTVGAADSESMVRTLLEPASSFPQLEDLLLVLPRWPAIKPLQKGRGCS